MVEDKVYITGNVLPLKPVAWICCKRLKAKLAGCSIISRSGIAGFISQNEYRLTLQRWISEPLHSCLEFLICERNGSNTIWYVV